VSDRKFRYVRDNVLTNIEFFYIILEMMGERGHTPDSLLSTLWLSADEVRELVRLGHSVGLHSHTHNRNMDTAVTEVQEREYSCNHEQLISLVHTDAALSTYSPFCMAHPLGKMRADTTFTVLEKLDIKVGFLAHDDGTPECDAAPYAVPRVDHSFVLRTIRQNDDCSPVDTPTGSTQSESLSCCRLSCDNSAHAISHSLLLNSDQREQRADVVCARALSALGVQACFGIPGVQNLALYRALSHVGGVECVLVESELNAMAVALGNSTLPTHTPTLHATGVDQPPLACINVIGGPGVTHALSGIALAARRQDPALVICTGVRSQPQRDFQLHDVDNYKILAPLCKAVFRVRHADALLDSLAAAAHIAKKSPCGPVAVELAADVLGIPLTPGDITNHTCDTVTQCISECNVHAVQCAALGKCSQGTERNIVVPSADSTSFLALLKCSIGAVGTTCSSLVVANDIPSFGESCKWAFHQLEKGFFCVPCDSKIWCAIPFAVGAALRLLDETERVNVSKLSENSLNGEVKDEAVIPRAIALTSVASLDYTALSATVALHRSDINILVCVLDDNSSDPDNVSSNSRVDHDDHTDIKTGFSCIPTKENEVLNADVPSSRTEAAARAVGAAYVDATNDDPQKVYEALQMAAALRGVVFVRANLCADELRTSSLESGSTSGMQLVVNNVLEATCGPLFVGG